MSAKGAASVIVIWVAFAVSAAALSAIARARVTRQLPANRVQQIRALFMIHAAAVTAHETDFREPVVEIRTREGRVTAVPSRGDDRQVVTLRCQVELPRFSRLVDIEWRRVGAVWRVCGFGEAT